MTYLMVLSSKFYKSINNYDWIIKNKLIKQKKQSNKK